MTNCTGWDIVGCLGDPGCTLVITAANPNGEC